jgi:hypothetical protein
MDQGIHARPTLAVSEESGRESEDIRNNLGVRLMESFQISPHLVG